jgi:hypothetical protein
MNNYDENVPLYLLIKSNLSWEEQQLIEYARRYPEKVQELLDIIKNEGDT